ncbi:MAG: response regulator [Kofleriaceae bacterium]
MAPADGLGSTAPGPLRVAVVDDDPSFLRSLTRSLARDGILVHGFDDGPALLAYLAEQDPEAAHFDAILVDLNLPSMRGDEVIAALGARGIPVVAATISAWVDGDGEARSRQAGALHVVGKTQAQMLIDTARVTAAVTRERRAAAQRRTRHARARVSLTEVRDFAASEAERERIVWALAQCWGSVNDAARMLSHDRSNLYRRMSRLGLRAAAFARPGRDSDEPAH